MTNTIILSYITFVYFGAFMLYLLMMVMGRATFGRLASLVTVVGLGAQSLAIILRWVESYQLGIGIAHFLFMDHHPSISHCGMAYKKQNPRGFCPAACIPGNGLCLFLSQHREPHPTLDPCAKEQLVDNPCHHLFLCIRCIRGLFWGEFDVLFKTFGQ